MSVGALVTLTAAAVVTTPLSAGASEPSDLSEYRVLVAYNGGETRVPVPYGATEALLEIGGGDGGTTSPCRNWRQATSPNVVDNDPLGAPAGGGRWITGTLGVQGGQALLVAPGGAGQTVDITPDTVSAYHLIIQEAEIQAALSYAAFDSPDFTKDLTDMFTTTRMVANEWSYEAIQASSR